MQDRRVTGLLPRVAVLLGFAALIAAGAWQSASTEAEASACASGCRAAYQQCRAATRGSPSCEAQYQACLRACVRR